MKCLISLVAGLSAIPCLASQGGDSASQVLQGKALSYWVEELKNANPLLRDEAILVLGQAGPAAKAAAPALADLLRDEYASVRVRAALALGKIGAPPPSARGVLLGAWKGEGRALRLEILAALGAFAGEEDVMPILLQAAQDKDDAIRTLALQALLQAGPGSAAALTRLVDHPDPAARQQAIQQLARLGSRAEAAIPALTARLKDDDWDTRFHAAVALWQIDRKTSGLNVLVEAASKKDAARRTAIDILLQVHPRPKEALPVFRAALKDSAPLTRVQAADALLEMEKKPADVLPTYVDVLENTKDLKARNQAVQALRRLGAEAKPARKTIVKLMQATESFSPLLPPLLAGLGPESVPDLVSMITKTTDKKTLGQVRLQAARTLGLFGKDGLKASRELLTHSEPLVRQAGLYALNVMGATAKDAVPDLIKLLDTSDLLTRRQVIQCLANMGTSAKDSLPRLLEIAKDKDLLTRREAMRALGRVGVGSPAVRAALSAAIKEGTSVERMGALEALWNVDPAAKEIVPAVRELLDDPKGNKSTVCKLVSQMGPAGKEFIPQVAALLNSRVFESRIAAETLEAMGPLAKEAVPAMVQALRTNEINVRVILARTLRKLEKEEQAAVRSLLDALASPNFKTSWAMILDTLEEFGPKAKEAVPRLLELMRDTAPLTRIRAAGALCAIDAEQLAAARPVLQTAMKATATSNSMQAALILWRADPKDQHAADVAIQRLQDASETNRTTAALMMRRAGPWAKAAVPALTKLLEASGSLTRVHAAVALWHIEPGNQVSEAVLLELMLPSEDLTVRQQAMLGLRELGAGAKNAVPALEAALQDPSLVIRTLAADLLRKLAPTKNESPP